MKTFDDFVATLDEKTISWVCEPIELANGRYNLADETDAKAFFSKLQGASFQKTLRLLSLYHEWLTEEN